MLIRRSLFFSWLFLLLVGPFPGYRFYWLSRTRRVGGRVYFTGHHFDPLDGISRHLNIIFPLGKDSVEFISNVNLRLPDGAPVSVRYRVDNPEDARIDRPVCIWGDTLVYVLSPLGIWLVLLLTPNRFDPLIPWGSAVQLLSRRPFLRIARKQDGTFGLLPGSPIAPLGPLKSPTEL
jgi:hypothetical protein